MKENGIMIWQMEKEIIFIVQGLNMKVSGKKTYKTDKELKFGQVSYFTLNFTIFISVFFNFLKIFFYI